MSDQTTAPRTYRQTAVLSASPAQLVLELYDAARRFLSQGATALSDRDIELAHNKLRRAEEIISYLGEVIDDEQGELAANLHSIYAFSLSHLNEARINLDAHRVQEVSALLGELRPAWQELARA
jgi:flagellar protein FliS